MNKLQKFTSNKAVKKVMTLILCVAMMLTVGISAFAADGDQVSAQSEAVSAVSQAFTTVTSTISVGNILKMVGIALAACVAFFFWWGIRKVIKMVTSAFKKGKVSV